MKEITIDVGAIDNLVKAWEQSPVLVEWELTAATHEALQLLEREIKEDTPTGATSALRQSIHGFIEEMGPLGVTGVVGTSMAHALPVELGTRPHFPPIEPLMDWVRSVLNIQDDGTAKVYYVAQAIARKIAARGTKGQFMFERNFVQLKPQVQRMYQLAHEHIAEGLAHG
ncbi:MAG: hypothetical protein RPU13_13870 [Candidatus Sedimenticola sp. (ex Thyasira tokunagai)]